MVSAFTAVGSMVAAVESVMAAPEAETAEGYEVAAVEAMMAATSLWWQL